MNDDFLKNLMCPKTGSELVLNNDALFNKAGEKYPIIDGIPSIIILNNRIKNEFALEHYKQLADNYDEYYHLNYETFFSKEEDTRNFMIDKLCLQPQHKVLELGAGTGRDSLLIAERLSEKGEIHVQDISVEMLNILKKKFEEQKKSVFITNSNAAFLPYKDNTFDAVFSFGSVLSGDLDGKDFYKEIIRVTKAGGKVVIGGRSMAPWLKNTVFAKIVINQNNAYDDPIDMNAIPVEARDVSISWMLSGTLCVIEFTVGEGEPIGNFDYEIPGTRGGTYLTRYYGQMEGVTEETKLLALKAREKLGVSMHKWLDELVKKEAKIILEDK